VRKHQDDAEENVKTKFLWNFRPVPFSVGFDSVSTASSSTNETDPDPGPVPSPPEDPQTSMDIEEEDDLSEEEAFDRIRYDIFYYSTVS
jgi:hypothetical protein